MAHGEERIALFSDFLYHYPMDTHDEKKRENSFYEKIRTIIASFAVTVGIIMSAVGGIIFLSSFAKMFLFERAPYVVDYEEQCRFRLGGIEQGVKAVTTGRGGEEIPPEALRSCVNRLERQDRERYRSEKLRSLVDAFSFLVVGMILLFSFKKVIFLRGRKGE